jgi:hypothetical protein
MGGSLHMGRRLASLLSRLDRRPILKSAAAVLGVVLLSLAAAAPVLNYSYWKIDEQMIVVPALGFLDFDFNPNWFGYHTLPMYLLSIPYFLLYFIYGALGWVASKVEFASLLFSDNAVFFIVARILCSLAYTTGVVVLARVVYRELRSALAAAVFVVLALTTVDAVHTASYARVDTFVFSFMSLMIYFSCYASKTLRSFVLSLLFCAAAIASKFPAVVFLPVLAVRLLWDVYRGIYPKKFIALLLLLPPLLVFVFMPYSVLDYEAYRPIFDDILKRTTENYVHVGKVVRHDLSAQLLAPWEMIASQIGTVPLLGTVAFALRSVFRDRQHLFPFLFVLSYITAFSTSAILDSYWLRPVYPAFLCFFTMGVMQLVNCVAAKTTEYRLHGVRLDKAVISRVALPVIAACILLARPAGMQQYLNQLTAEGEDTRVVSSQWIQKNIPVDSKIVLCGTLQQFLPRVFAKRKAVTLQNTYLNGFNVVKNSDIVRKGFDFFFDANKRRQHPLDVEITVDWKRRLKSGTYVVITGSIYRQYYEDHVVREIPTEAAKFRRFYDLIREQKRLARFTGRGMDIEIYQMETDYIPPKK